MTDDKSKRPVCPKCGSANLYELVTETQRGGEDEKAPTREPRGWRCWGCMHRWERDAAADV